MNDLQRFPWQFSHRCYGWGATSENRSKIGDFPPTLSLWSKISRTRGRPKPIIFARLVRPMNALQLCRWQFSHKETFWQTFFMRSVFLMEIGRFVFEAPFGGLRGNVRRSSQAHWKARSGLPISVNWTFFTRCYGWGATSDYWLEIGDFAPTGVGWPKISPRRGWPPPTILLLRKLG